MEHTRLRKLVESLIAEGRITEDEKQALEQCIEVNAEEAEMYDTAMPIEVRRGIKSLLYEY